MQHLDAAAHTRGESRFVDDVPPPGGLLHAAVCGSPVAHGEIREVDDSAARELAGVVAVLRAGDIPGDNQIGPIFEDEPLLAAGEVHFAGQPVALVVAQTPEIARRAARAIRVEVDERPAVTDPRQAFERGEIIDRPHTFEHGDVDAAWGDCDVVVEGSCDIGGQEHVYLETQRARAIPLEGGRVRLHASTQSPFAAQRIAARVLGLAYHAIEVDVERLGGGFGGKEDQATPWACLAALAALATGRPVELVLRRDEDMRMTGKRHPYVSDFKIGLTRQGEIVAYEVWHYQNSGAAADLSTPVLARTMFHSTGSYRVPNARIFAVCCRTHLPPNTAFRGFGGPQGMFVIESALAAAAEALEVPREQLQRKNLLRDGDVFPYGQVVEGGRAEATWDEASAAYDAAAIAERVERYNREHFETKKGFAAMPVCFGISFTATYMNQAGALVHVYTDGSVSVTTGGVEMGQGLATNIAAITARGLGVAPERIRVETTNTTRVANMSASAASATTLLNGNAALRAVEQITGRLRALAAEKLGAAGPEAISIVGEAVLHDGRDTGWTWERLVREAYLARVGLSAHGHYATPDVWFDPAKGKGHPFAYHVYGTALFEVTLDCLRGVYEVDAVKIVHDLGRSLNRRIDLGQVEGGLAQGLGWMTLEELRYDQRGQLLSNALASYKVPDVYFLPDDLQVKFLEDVPSRPGPYGSKAVGEPPLMYGIGVFFALRHAMRAFRPEAELPFASPLTPERVLMQLHAGEVAGMAVAAPVMAE